MATPQIPPFASDERGSEITALTRQELYGGKPQYLFHPDRESVSER
ncbi:MAG: hypothetical protein JXC33_05525 [Deltaproteobacteria bacterium]|nr:hypothetical protein [Deltaproteobacteria bacterium]